MLVTMLFQTLYVLVDLYWVGRLGTEAVAAVGVSGNLMFVVLAATQMLAVGTTTAISHAAGRRDPGSVHFLTSAHASHEELFLLKHAVTVEPDAQARAIPHVDKAVLDDRVGQP